MKAINILILQIILLCGLSAQAQIQIGSTKLDSLVLATNLSTPWDLFYTADSSLWFTERIGKVSRINLKNNKTSLVLDLRDSVHEIGEGGLLGMTIINTSSTSKVFLAYNYKAADNNYFERLVKFDYDSIQDSLMNQTILIDHIPAASNHNGSRLEIVNNQLFMTTGDAANQSSAQNINSLSGKVLRIELNGDIPFDNPILNSPIYSWGHRNPQGLVFANGFLYSSEHGPSTDDEINIIKKGGNYGWPNVNGFCNTAAEIAFCNDSNVIEPLISWTPTIAPSGICYYDHDAIPEFKSSILLTTLKNQRLKALQLNNTKDSIIGTADYLINRWGRLRAVTTSPDGAIYIATNSNPQRIIKLWNASFTSINEISDTKDQLTFYPNPAKGYVTIEINSKTKIDFEMTIYDLNGRGMIAQQLSKPKTKIITDNFKSGIYLIEIKNENGFREVKRIVVY